MTPVEQRYLENLRQTQWLARDRLDAYHESLLAHVCGHAHDHVPAYRDRLAPLFTTGKFNLENWNALPTFERAEIQTQPELFRATVMPEELGAYSQGYTSGTSGTRLNFIQSAFAITASICQGERTLEVFGIDRTAHRASIRAFTNISAPYPEGFEKAGWNLTCPTARSSFLDIGTTIAEQAEWLIRRAPRYLQTYPSTAVALADHLNATGQLLRLWGVMTVGESLAPDARDKISDAFSCAVIDHYGATELGYLAFQCPGGDGYHIAHESARIDLVDPRGAPALPGEIGRMVITSLYNFAMPFIRYAIGDYAIAADGPCACGRTLPRLVEIIGRTRNIFVFPDGTQHSPWKFRTVFKGLLRARQVQIVQTARDMIELRYISDGGPPPDAAAIERAGRHGIHPDVTVRAVEVATIPRSPSGKIEDCVSLVGVAER